jgi:(p)ppGpp synthase/HD superfamily hydrolase
MRAERRIPRARPKTAAALEYAGRAHGGQRRAADRAPFIVHPCEVASLPDLLEDRIPASPLVQRLRTELISQ